MLFFSDEFGPQSRGWELEVRLENETQSKQGNVLIDWNLTGAQKQVGSGRRCLTSFLRHDLLAKFAFLYIFFTVNKNTTDRSFNEFTVFVCVCVCVQIQATGSWTSAGTQTEAMIDLKQPFTSTLSHLRLQVLSHNHAQGHDRNNQVQVIYTHTHALPVSSG